MKLPWGKNKDAFIEANKSETDLRPEAIKLLRKHIEETVPDLDEMLYDLTKKFAQEHCKLRFGCDTIGMIEPCFSCLSQFVLVPMIQNHAGGKFRRFHPRPTPGGK